MSLLHESFDSRGSDGQSHRPCVLFDFDGTLTQRDSFRLLIVCFLRRSPLRLVLLALGAPLFVATGLLHWDKRYVKSWILWCLTVGLGPRQSFADLAGLPREHVRDSRFWNEAVCECLRSHQRAGHRIVICTASAAEWVAPMLREHEIECDDLVGSVLVYRWGGVIMASPNCYATEKLRRLRHLTEKHPVVAAYSDHPSDIPLLNAAHHAWVVAPRPEWRPKFQESLNVPWSVLGEMPVRDPKEKASQ